MREKAIRYFFTSPQEAVSCGEVVSQVARDLNGGALVDFAIGTNSQEYRPHTATTQQTDELISAAAVAGPRLGVRGVRAQLRRCCARGTRNRAVRR